MEVGRLVLSTQGRDSGRYFIVYQVVDEDFVRIVDGKLHKLVRPKLKKVKHLQAKPFLASELFAAGMPEQDARVRKALAAWEQGQAMSPTKEEMNVQE